MASISTDYENISQIQVLSVSGQLVNTTSINGNLNNHELDLQNIPSGMYFIKLTDTEGSERTSSLVVK